MERNQLTQEVLKGAVVYNPASGLFQWKEPRAGRRLNRAMGVVNGNGYLMLSIYGVRILAHRAAWLYVHGEMPDCIDHINGVRTDNRISNLRNVTPSINMQNRRNPRKNSKTGFLGVTMWRDGVQFRSIIKINGREKHLGVFKTAEEAHQAYVAAKRQYHEGCTI